MMRNPAGLDLSELIALSHKERSAFGVQYTPGEILQQPETWKRSFAVIDRCRAEILKFLTDHGFNGPQSNLAVTLIGAGTSDYIGRSLAAEFREKWRCHAEAVPSTTLMTEIDSFVGSSTIDTRHLWISFSRSGDSFEGVRVLEHAFANYPSIKHIIVTCDRQGKMARDLADRRENTLCLTLPDEVNDRGLAMTSSFTNMVVAGLCLANINDLENFGSSVEILSGTAAGHLHDIAVTAQHLANERFERICFLGSGPLKAVADESSLKTLELSGGFHSTMSESFLGLRHGPLSWLNDNSLVVGFVSNDPEKAKVELGLLLEVRKKQAARSIIAIGPASAGLDRFSDHNIEFPLPPGFSDGLLPPLYVIFAQCLGLYSSLTHGLKPDAPSADGKITRVVSDITTA